MLRGRAAFPTPLASGIGEEDSMLPALGRESGPCQPVGIHPRARGTAQQLSLGAQVMGCMWRLF